MTLRFVASLLIFSLCSLGVIGDSCFAQIKGPIEDTVANAEVIEELNNLKIYPRLKSILSSDFFRFFKVSLNKLCPFWEEDNRCALRDCHVKDCKTNDLPEGLRDSFEASIYFEHERNKYLKKYDTKSCSDEEKLKEELGLLDVTISNDGQAKIDAWSRYDDSDETTFCELDDEHSSNLVYVDLLKNPERFTGYADKPAHRIWNSIYEENCFKQIRIKGIRNFISLKAEGGLPLSMCFCSDDVCHMMDEMPIKIHRGRIVVHRGPIHTNIVNFKDISIQPPIRPTFESLALPSSNDRVNPKLKWASLYRLLH